MTDAEGADGRDAADGAAGPRPGGPTLHATALVLGTRGVLLLGPAGSGKTTLALSLLESWRARGRYAALVADDRVRLARHGGRILASAPPAIAGLAELAGHGIVRPPAARAAVLALAARLVPPETVEPIPPPDARVEILGIALPLVRAPARGPRATALVEAALGAVEAGER